MSYIIVSGQEKSSFRFLFIFQKIIMCTFVRFMYIYSIFVRSCCYAQKMLYRNTQQNWANNRQTYRKILLSYLRVANKTFAERVALCIVAAGGGVIIAGSVCQAPNGANFR